MATVHYENGKYHVHYQVAEEQKRNNDEKSPCNNRKVITSDEYTMAINTIDKVKYHSLKCYNNSPVDRFKSFSPSADYPPPR